MSGEGKKSVYRDKDKPTQIRYSNITAAKGRQGRRRSHAPLNPVIVRNFTPLNFSN